MKIWRAPIFSYFHGIQFSPKHYAAHFHKHLAKMKHLYFLYSHCALDMHANKSKASVSSHYQLHSKQSICNNTMDNHLFNEKEDEELVNEILRLAHKIPSPRSVAAPEAGASQDNDNSAKVKCLAKEFLERVLRLTEIVMGHNHSLTVRPQFVSQALEYYIQFDVEPYSHSYMLDNEEDADEFSEESAWSKADAENEIMYDDDDDMEESEAEDNDRWDSEDETEENDDDIDSNLREEVEREEDPVHTPNFDAIFEPIPKINFADDKFRHIMRYFFQNSMRFDPEIEGGAEGILKHAMYAFVVTQMRTSNF